MHLIFFNQIIFLTICLGYGLLFSKIFNLQKIYKNLNIFDISIFGIIFVGLIGQLSNFFFPLNDLYLFVNLSFSLTLTIFFYFKYSNFCFLKKNHLFIFLLFLFLTYLNIYSSGFSDDLNHYHYGYINNTDNIKYIFGQNFLHSHFGFSPIWLVVNSSLNFDSTRLQDIHITNSIPFLLVLSTFVVKIFQNIRDKKYSFLTILKVFLTFFILLKYTRLKEYGIDRSVFLLFFYFIYLFAYFVENYLIKKDLKNYQDIFFVLFFFSFFIFSNKITFLPIFIFLLLIFIKSNNKLIYFKNFRFILLLLAILSYVTKNIIITGCLIYPIPQTCLNILTWNSGEIASDLITRTEIFNKSFPQYVGDLDKLTYIKNFNWLMTWFVRTKIELIELLSLFILILTLIFITFKKNGVEFVNKKGFFLILSFSLALLLFFLLSFLKSPVIRMSHHIFILFFILFPLVFFKKKIRIRKKVFFIFLFICFSFNTIKNFKRIYSSNFINSPIDNVQSQEWYNEADIRKLDNFIYYSNWGEAPTGSPINNEKFSHKKVLGYDIIFKK